MAYTPKLTYKGRPLVRCGNDIYYGSMKDPFVDESAARSIDDDYAVFHHIEGVFVKHFFVV